MKLFGVEIGNPAPKLSPEAVESRLKAASILIDTANHCWRCGNCSEMQPAKSKQAWIEDSIRSSDPLWSVTERQKQRAWNGGFTAWCLDCAAKLLGKTA